MNTFGRIFRISIYGESHSDQIGISIDGMPAGTPINLDDMQKEIDRRKPNAKGTTPRKESDLPIISCGVHNSITTGAPINITFKNEDTIAKDYSIFRDMPRPGHSDFPASVKFNKHNDIRGGGMFSGRLTLALVAAGYFAKLICKDIEAKATILELHGNSDIHAEIEQAVKQRDSIGGIIETHISNVPAGLGEPFFDSLEAYIAHLAFSIPGIKGIEFGAGFASTRLYGSENNDAIISENGKTKTNNSGGINGGISNGNEVIFRVAAKPTSSIAKSQETWNFTSNSIETLEVRGRHDTCFALRVPPILEAISYIALADLMMIRKTQI